jgi:hypothetical protein
MHFEETQIERDRHMRPRHLLVAALRTVADRARLPALTEIDWDALRRRLGYVTIVPPDSQERWGITHSEPAVMEAIAAANEAATRSHPPTCDVPLQWTEGTSGEVAVPAPRAASSITYARTSGWEG